MSVETSRPFGPVGADPDLSMGLKLLSDQHRARLVQMMKLGTVWIALVTILAIALLQLRVDPSYVVDHRQIVIDGMWVTIGVSLISIAFATILALFGALGRLSRSSIAQGISGFYVSLVRGTPLLIQIYLIYSGLPQIGKQLTALGFPQLGRLLVLDATQAGILALSLNYGAYMTEIFRAGIQSIGHGQREAAEALGMTHGQMLRRIILPQAVHVIIPDIGNQFIAMQKDSALVSVIGIWEITFRANRFARQDSKFIEMYLLAAALYWFLTIISSWLQSRLERRMAHAYER